MGYTEIGIHPRAFATLTVLVARIQLAQSTSIRHDEALNVLPREPPDNYGYIMASHAKVASDVCVSFSSGSTSPDLQNIFFRQFGGNALLASIICTVQNPIVLVCAWRVPCEIRDVVVGWIAVDVPALHSIRAWSDKCCENQDVYGCLFRVSIVTNANAEITQFVFCESETRGICPGFICSNSANRQDGPMLIDGVARVARDLAKAFRDVRIEIRHGSAPYQSRCVEKSVRFTRPSGLRLFDNGIIAK